MCTFEEKHREVGNMGTAIIYKRQNLESSRIYFHVFASTRTLDSIRVQEIY